MTGALLDDLEVGRDFADFRIRLNGLSGLAVFDGPSGAHPSALVVVYAD